MTSPRNCVLQNQLFTSTRLYSLYSDFRKLQQVNTDGFEANLIAWKSLIDDLFSKNALEHRFVLNTDGLVESLTLSEYGKPLALDLVLEDLIANRELIPLNQFLQQKDSIYAKKWVKPLISWSINKFIMSTSYKVSNNKHELKSDSFVSKKRLEAYEKELAKKLVSSSTHSKSVFTESQLFDYIASLDIQLGGLKVELSALDFQVLLKFLERDLKTAKVLDDIVKLGDHDITEEDIAIAQIKSTLIALEARNSELQTKIDQVTARIKQSLNNKNNRELLLNLLRSKRIAESSLSKQIASQNQLDSVLYKIDESSTNLQLISAIEKGSSILKSLNKQIGGVEKLEQLMDDLEDEKSEADEITKQLSQVDKNVDDEIENELQDMLREEESKKGLTNNDDELLKKLGTLSIQPTSKKTQDKEASDKKRVAEGVSNI